MNYKLLLAGTVSIFLFAFILYQTVPSLLERETVQQPTEEFETAATTTIDEQETPNNTGEVKKESTSADTKSTKPSSDNNTTPTLQNGYTRVEVTAHASQNSCWTIINSSVYDITSYVPRHPGGKSAILKICGKDGSVLFEGQHGGQSRPEQTLERFYIGPLL